MSAQLVLLNKGMTEFTKTIASNRRQEIYKIKERLHISLSNHSMKALDLLTLAAVSYAVEKDAFLINQIKPIKYLNP